MRVFLAACMAATLVGCSQIQEFTGDASCNGSAAAEVTLDIVRDQIIKLATETDSAAPALSKAKIRATVRELNLSLQDVRTTKDDPESSKKFCTGTLRLVAPPQMVLDADQTRQDTGMPNVEEAADNVNVTKAANAFEADINFNVQPTDDGSKLFSEVEDGSEAFRFFAELVQASLLRSTVAEAEAANDRMMAEQQAEIEAASRAVQQATLEEAKANNAAAVSTINAIWKAIPSGARQQMLPAQRAWLKRTTAACQLEAANEVDAQEVARLNCETREQNSRSEYLRSFATEAINQEYGDQ